MSIQMQWNQFYLDGNWIEQEKRKAITDRNPFNDEIIADVPAADIKDADRAFELAEKAQAKYSYRTPQEMAQPIVEAISIIEAHWEDISHLLMTESGSTLNKSIFEVQQVALPMMREATSFPFRAFGSYAPSVIPGKENIVKRVPAGIVSVISPWNVPLHLSMRAVAPALALGNAVILKPSSDTPITGGLLLAWIFDQTSLPKGLLSVLPGSGATIGDHIASHPLNRVIAFTGSTEVGAGVASKAAAVMARPAMELGGNGPHIVLEDADLDRAVAGGIFGSFFHQGQICMRINRHLVHRSLYEAYVAMFTERAANLAFGDPIDPKTIIGPVINKSQRDKIMNYIQKSIEAGAVLTTGGKAHGLVIEPTVLRDMRNEMPAAWNEVFGPVAPIIQFDTDEEAIQMANATRYGLSASVHSRDLEHALQIASRINSGMVHINDQSIQDEPHVPFGGMKMSGMGRYNGEAIIEELTELKWVSIQHEPRKYPF
jgi:NAD-dependent aldehyde dehydrogenases